MRIHTTPGLSRTARMRRQLTRILGIGLVVAACGHDAPRRNPLDPGLTPPVELTAVQSDTTGAVSLAWTRYAGESPFAGYLVLRRAARSSELDTIRALSHPDSTTATDASLAPGTSYIYQVAVTNAGGLSVLSDAVTVSGYTVGAVSLLAAEADPLGGAVRLRWTRFADPGFEQYQVVRHQVGTDIDTTIFLSTAVGDTVSDDTTAAHSVPYSYVVQSVAAGQTLTSNGRNTILELPAVSLSAPTFESDAASAQLRWSAYSGPGFGHYEVQRRTSQLSYATVATFDDPADTSFADKGLRGDTEYSYRIAVVTARGEAVLGSEHGGGIHRLVDTWELADASMQPGIRLHRRPDNGRVEALLSLGDEDLYAAELAVGRPLSLRVALPYLTDDTKPGGYNTAAAYSAAGNRQLIRLFKEQCYLSTYGLDGGLVWREDDLELAIPDLPGSGARGELALTTGFYRDLTLSSAGQAALETDFAEWARDYPEVGELATGTFGAWEVVRVWVPPGIRFASVYDSMVARGAAWTQLAVEVLIAARGVPTTVRLGPPDGDHLLFTMAPPPGADLDEGQISLEWFTAAADGGPPQLHSRVSRSHNGDRLAHDLVMGAADGRAWASLRTTEYLVKAFDDNPVYCSAANIQGVVYATIDDSAYTVTADHHLDLPAPLPGRVAETRTWLGRRGERAGIAVPHQNTVLFGDLIDGAGADWPAYLAKAIGPAVGNVGGFLISPISFDVGPDERFFVLDAGNRRIVVFDSLRRYVTEFGGLGDGPGQFNFGGGGTAASTTSGFFGSVAVDADGYIYVADEINRRIQVFEP